MRQNAALAELAMSRVIPRLEAEKTAVVDAGSRFVARGGSPGSRRRRRSGKSCAPRSMRRDASGSSVVGRQRFERGGHSRRVCRLPIGCSPKMLIRAVRPVDTESWLAMRMALWPETDVPQHRREMAMMLSDDERFAVLVCQDALGDLVGFAEVSLRSWAEGCASSPVGYLEGWYVSRSARRRGIGSGLVAAAEDWARSRGCSEMASDTELANRVSEAAHLRLGYRIVARVTAFRKRLI
jgi:aminoglycoside 6'-N-acetyltransferase I